MKEEDHIDALTNMILEGKEEEEQLADALKKILDWVDENQVRWEYGVYEVAISGDDRGIQERLQFLAARGKEGWELCSEVSAYDLTYGNLTRYTFKRKHTNRST